MNKMRSGKLPRAFLNAEHLQEDKSGMDLYRQSIQMHRLAATTAMAKTETTAALPDTST